MNVALTPIDEAVHGLDTVTEPWTIQLEVGLPGRLDPERLRTAVRLGADRHSMARVRLDPAATTWRQHFWKVLPDPDIDPLRVVECPDDEAIDAARSDLYSVQIPLAESPPFRVRLVHGPRGDLLMLSVNHAAFDGFGALRLLQSIARAYAATPDPPSPVDLQDARDLDSLLGADNRTERGQRWQRLLDKARDAASPPFHIHPEFGDDLPGYGFQHRALSAEDSEAVSRRAGPATVNDKLMGAMHLAIERWAERSGDTAKRISVLMPVNLRPSEWQQDVVTNMVVETRVATTAGQRTSRGDALDTVVTETERIKHGGAAALFDVLRVLPSVPLPIKDRLSSVVSAGSRMTDTAVLSNLGRIEDLPSFGAEAGAPAQLWFSAPAKMPCGLSAGAVSVLDRLQLAFRYRRSMWHPKHAAEFCDLYVDELLALAAG
jgi:NRPS condensation-like uncharacterized protein